MLNDWFGAVRQLADLIWRQWCAERWTATRHKTSHRDDTHTRHDTHTARLYIPKGPHYGAVNFGRETSASYLKPVGYRISAC